jgi:hypothetical protein
MMMGPLDGNAMAGVMHDLFARDMTTIGYKCTSCGRTGVAAEMAVYMSGPGTVARCMDCDTILLMLSERHGMYCIDMPAMAQTVFPLAYPWLCSNLPNCGSRSTMSSTT